MKLDSVKNWIHSAKQRRHGLGGKRLTYGAAIVVGAFLLLLWFFFQWIYETSALETTREFIGGMGWVGVPVYIAFFALGCFFFIPATALSVVGPALFGPWIGLVAILAGNMAAATAIFSLTRWVGHRWGFLRGFQNRFPDMLIQFARGKGLLIVFYANFMMLPASLINYTAGLLPISFLAHSLGTLLGIFPHCLSTALFVGILHDAFLSRSWASLFRWETGLLVVVYAVTILSVYQIKRRIDQVEKSDGISPTR